MSDDADRDGTDDGRATDATHPEGGSEYGRKMKDMDHSSPVEGPNRTFERGPTEPEVDE